MALQEKVVRLSHQQLKELAKKYERNDSDDTDAQTGHGKKMEKFKRNKKPEREIYQPGHRLRNQRVVNNMEDVDDSKDIEGHDESDIQIKGDEIQKCHDIEEVQSKIQDLDLTSHTVTSSDERSESDAVSGSKQGKKKQKRPDQQIYRPRIVQQHVENLGDKVEGKEMEDMVEDEIPVVETHISTDDYRRKTENYLPRSGHDEFASPEGGDPGRYSKPGRQTVKGHRQSRGKDSLHIQKSRSLDWDDSHSKEDDPTVSTVSKNESGWGTDYGKDEEMGHENVDSRRGRRKRRDRRSSGQKHCDNRRTALPKQHSHGDSKYSTKPETSACEDHANSARNVLIPDQPPKITSDDNIAQSINKGMFQGMVFTNSRMSDECLESNNQNITEVPHVRQQKMARDQHRNTERNKSREMTYHNQSNGVNDSERDSATPNSGVDDSKSLTWDEQVEVAETEERRRLTAVIEGRERKMSGQRKGHDSRSRGTRKDGDRQSDFDDGRNRGKHGSKDHNQHKGDKNKAGKDHSKKGPSLKVTFASGKEQRKVVIPEHEKSSSEEKELESSVTEPSVNGPNKPGRGGLIKLPMSTVIEDPVMQHSGQASVLVGTQHHHHHHQRGTPQHHRGRGRAQVRGAGHRALYDPKNPSKTVPVSSSPQGLHFFDSMDPHQNSPPAHQVPYFPDQFSCNYVPGDYASVMPNYHDYNCPGPQPSAYYGLPPTGIQPLPVLPPFYDRTPVRPDECTRELYERSFERICVGAHITPANRTKAVSLLKEIQPLDNQLTNLVARGVCHADSLAKMNGLRKEIAVRFEQVILLDPEECNKQNLDQMLWKCVYYQVIEMLRKLYAERTDDVLKDALHDVLDEGSVFYENLLKKLESTYTFTVESFVDPNLPPPENLSKATKFALYCAQKAMIALGDIARYKEQVNQTANYGKARNWYMKAQQIAPKNGRPYNQLAILALYTRRKLDAVYYYMRSLAASNPFITARESLMSLFDEARKRAEVSEKKHIKEIGDRKKQQKQANIRQKMGKHCHRVEVWIAPDGTTCQDEIHPGDDEFSDLMKISAVELNKRFILSFLNVHGKLFTKIGMETFPEVSSQMLHEFKALLKHSPSPLGTSRLLQLVTINMFAIENTIPQDTSTIEENCRSLHQEYAIQLALDMFGLIAERCTQLLQAHLQSGDCQILSEDLHCLFPSVKLCGDWMECHTEYWNPPPVPRDPELGPTIDVWSAIAGLFNVLKEVDISHVKLYNCKKEGCDPIVLHEDRFSAGFTPLLHLPDTIMYVHSTVDKDIARDCLRVQKVYTFCEYLCGIDQPLLSFDGTSKQYISIAPVSTLTESQSQLTDSLVEEDVIIESESDEEKAEFDASFGSSGDESHIKALRARKEELERKMAEKEKRERTIKAVLDDTGQHNRRIEIEVRPLMLVPDTNCFIDHLDGIKSLLASKKYTIVVPLVVINELDGLAKGSREGQYDTMEHAEMVYRGAQETLQFLENEFDSRNSHLKALTSKGSVLDTITYRAEETTDEGNNDDLILSCCLHYCQDKARDFMPKSSNDPIKLYRVVVLLTDDRNLRLKAHTRNVPVKDLPSFLRWAKIG